MTEAPDARLDDTTEVDATTALADMIENARITEDLLREGLLEDVEELASTKDWRELPLPDHLVVRIETFENEQGAVEPVHYTWMNDNYPCQVMAADPDNRGLEVQDAVLFATSEVTVAVGAEGLVSHSLICRRGR